MFKDWFLKSVTYLAFDLKDPNTITKSPKNQMKMRVFPRCTQKNFFLTHILSYSNILFSSLSIFISRFWSFMCTFFSHSDEVWCSDIYCIVLSTYLSKLYLYQKLSGSQLPENWPLEIVGQLWAICGPIVGQLWANCGQIVGKLWSNCGQIAGQLWANCGLIVGRIE